MLYILLLVYVFLLLYMFRSGNSVSLYSMCCLCVLRPPGVNPVVVNKYISYHIISYHIISYHILYHIVYHIIYHIITMTTISIVRNVAQLISPPSAIE
jgi:hypothetical protein